MCRLDAKNEEQPQILNGRLRYMRYHFGKQQHQTWLLIQSNHSSHSYDQRNLVGGYQRHNKFKQVAATQNNQDWITFIDQQKCPQIIHNKNQTLHTGSCFNTAKVDSDGE